MAAARQKILIVDDDSNIAELISLYLMKECYETKIVGDGEAAIAAVESFEPDLILLDLMLPGMDGYQVCREVRSGKDTPIIMLSAKGEIFDKVLGLEMGADDYMQKPFDSKELVARVKAVLRRYNKKPAAETAGSGDKTVSYPDLTINLTNYSVTYTGEPTTPSHIRESRSTCPPRNWNFSTASPRVPTASLPESSFWTRSGAMSMWGIPAQSTCISKGSARRSTTMRVGRSLRSGASATSLRPIRGQNRD